MKLRIHSVFRMAWFATAGLVLAATWFTGLRMLPAFAACFADFGYKPPVVTNSVLAHGPWILVCVGGLSAWLIAMGELRPAFRRWRTPVMVLVVALLGISIGTLFI